MRVKLGVLIAGIGLLMSGARIAAHHSTAADFDEDKSVTIKGTVSKIEWENPHARFFVDRMVDGKMESWSFELASPNSLTRGGWGRRTLTVGEEVTASGSPARSGKTMAVTHSVIKADGKKLFTGTMGITDK
jgi:hypothetical protein